MSLPDEIAEWAQLHGLSGDDPDVYVLVTTEEEADEVIGEVAYRRGKFPAVDVARIRAALVEQEKERRLFEPR